ncbi:restriction endonuclease fold toxin [Streptomyces sp. H39-S7]|uniref:restriction endonuclease fold toxin n=1 Tax=Streptomyces sp. H39-S7 TaxID=3004357 RepID=UPI0022AF5B56|nr:restriction endonuclease fold toxin [Streptomyces sp. H39-S7]MCZ4122653.1 hypothetical protein [Streptomyces sp. H39-S7]
MATVALGANTTFATSQIVQAGQLPVWLTPLTPAAKRNNAALGSDPLSAHADVKVAVAAPATARAAGLSGPVVTLQTANVGAAAGQLRVAIGSDQLDASYGADAASRSRLVALPACALTTPKVAGCLTATPLPSHFDAATKRLVADVTLPAAKQPAIEGRSSSPTTSAAGAMTIAAVPTASGGGGTYTATSLTPSAAWSAGSSGGGFNYSYPIQVPPALGGDAPNVALSYNSSSVDGRTSSTNAQASWIGDGWDYTPGFVERSYKSCDKGGLPHSGDACWGGYNAVLSLGGHSSELVKDDQSGTWRLKNDDGSKVEFRTGATNGTSNGEYVRVSTSSGSVYYFGLNHLPSADPANPANGGKTDPATGSAWSEPVYSPKSGDPCYDAAKGSASWCQMAWRLNLDYAVDPHGNLTTYTYTPELNYYARGGGQNPGAGVLTSYTRGGALASIAYGQRLTDQIAAKGANKPAAKVDFTPDPFGRCSTLGGFVCTTLTKDNAAHWPDVPYDQNCASSGTCTNYGPSFWSNISLASISTSVLSNGAAKPVDTYTLTHTYEEPADGTKPSLWLAKVLRTGKNGPTAVPLKPVSFAPAEMPNRVDGTDLVPAPGIFNRPRIKTLTTETGENIVVDYNLPDCSRVAHTMPASADTDTKACYNVKWTPPGSAYGADPTSDWFNHYTVNQVTESDPVAHSTAKVTSYKYGPAAWHFNENELTETKSRTWDEFRGFATVTTTTGTGQDGPASQVVTKYLQGMDGDATAVGGKKSVTVDDSLGESVTDSDWLSGQVLESDTYNQAGGTVTAYSVTRATGPSTTATHVRGTGLLDLVARYGATTTVATSKARRADGSWRTSTTTTRTDPDFANRTISVDTTADGQPEQCTLASYAVSSNALITGLVAGSTKLSGTGACAVTATATNTISATRTFYDMQPYQKAGVEGNATSAQVLDHYDGSGNAVYITTATSTYDAYGRTTSITDPNSTDAQHPGGATTSTTYTPAYTGELPATVTITSPAPGSTVPWTTKTSLDIARDLPLTSTDANGKVTVQSYDALGRLTAVWKPGRTTAQNANFKYAYAVNGTSAPSTVTTSVLSYNDAQYSSFVQLFDGFGRSRQTQTTPGISAYTGRVLSDTFYDSQGRTIETRSPYYDDTAVPGGTLFQTPESQVPGQNSTVYDGRGRPTAQVFSSYGVEQWRTTTAYPGVDETDVTPPTGGTATTAITDGLGRTSQLWQYKTPTATGHADDAEITTYTFTSAGHPAGRTDTTGKNTWTYQYDLRGRQISATDPDTGKSTRVYDADGRLAMTTDARQKSLSYTYDLIGRQTGSYSGSSTIPANQLTAATYDSISGAKGQPVSSTRYVGGAGGSAYTSQVTAYDIGYRPTSTTVTIPSVENGLANTYTSQALYYPISGNIQASRAPAMGDVPAETLTYGYDVNGPLLSFGSASTTYDLATNYDAFGQAMRTTVNPWGTQIVATQNHDLATGALLTSWIDKQTAANGATQQSTYTYNPAGQVTAIQNIPDNTPAQTDLQCFTYDNLNRLTTAWTDTGGIVTKPQPSVSNIGGCKNITPTSGTTAGSTTVGGPAAYWTSYGYDTTGNRTSLTQHDTAGDAAKDITTTQAFVPTGQTNQPTTAPGTGGGTGGPHALASTTSTGPNNPGPSAYQYDAIGDTTSITTTAGTTTLAWDVEDKLTSVNSTGTSTSYLYDASGSQLIRRNPGKTTLNLGVDELTLDTTTNQLHDVRTYALPNGLTAVIQSTGITWQVGDPHGTAGLALDSATLAETRRPVDPFGTPRGTQPTNWAGDHGFVGGTQDPATGLTNLGAREYQPTTGRFLNPDPLLDKATPQQWNGYSYSNNNPVNLSDPTGTDPAGTQNGCGYDLSQCNPQECQGVNGTPCGSEKTTYVGGKPGVPGLKVGTYKDGQPTLDNIRVPTYKELDARGYTLHQASYGELIGLWIKSQCGSSPVTSDQKNFCNDASDAGLLADHNNVTECVSHGRNCGAAALDLLTAALLVASFPAGAVADEGALVAREAAVAGEEGAVVGAAESDIANIASACEGGCINGGLGKLVDVAKPDPAADALAERLGGVSRVRFKYDPAGREYDAISDRYVAQSKPAGFRMGSAFRNQAKATFEAAIKSGRTPYFHFEGPPEPGVISKIQEYGNRYGIQAVIDTSPLG